MLAAAGLLAQDCHIPLRGIVLDADTNEPIPYASIHVHAVDRGTQSDESGAFILPNLCEGTTYIVEVHHVGCVHQTQVVQLQESTLLKFALQHNQLLDEVLVSEKAYTPPLYSPKLPCARKTSPSPRESIWGKPCVDCPA
jgi:hypothetical protein